MTFRSKRSIASIVAGVAIMIAYIIYAKGSNAPAPDDIQGWAIAMLVCIGIGIVLNIIVQIVFHIGASIGISVKNQGETDEQVERIINNDMLEDEMSKAISLKASHTSSIISGAGLIALLIILALGLPIVAALNVLFFAGMISSLGYGAVEIFLNERGVY